MKPILTILLLSICSQITTAQTTHPYIEAFQLLAIEEMDRTGIPASITLAQGIIESAWGKGVLARSSNNHFGIKCKLEWAGKVYQLEDDDYDSEGNLVKSCFRAYDDAASSYIDHSNFLRKGNRYAFLFDLDPTDYVSWARGLQTAGYATDPEYANKLINKIEEYSLFIYDYSPAVMVMEDLGKTGGIESLGNDPSTVVETEVMEAPEYVLPKEVLMKIELADVNINENETVLATENSQAITTEIIGLSTETKEVEKVNINKGKMTLHGAFGEI